MAGVTVLTGRAKQQQYEWIEVSVACHVNCVSRARGARQNLHWVVRLDSVYVSSAMFRSNTARTPRSKGRMVLRTRGYARALVCSPIIGPHPCSSIKTNKARTKTTYHDQNFPNTLALVGESNIPTPS